MDNQLFGGSVMNGKFLGNVGLCIVILALVAFAVSKINASATGFVGVLLPEVQVSDLVTELGDSLSLVDSSVNVPQNGHMVDASFVIENSGANDIKNIAVLCTLFDGTGRELGRNKWVAYNTVKSQETEAFSFYEKMFISSDTVRSECEIVDVQLIGTLPASAHHGSGDEGHENPVENAGHATQHE